MNSEFTFDNHCHNSNQMISGTSIYFIRSDSQNYYFMKKNETKQSSRLFDLIFDF